MSRVVIIGGDKRQCYLKDILTGKNFDCVYINSAEDYEKQKTFDCFDTVVLPLPVTKDKEYIYSDNKNFRLKIKDIIRNISANQLLICSGADKDMLSRLKEKGAEVFDINGREDFILFNSYLTAQGALRLLLENTEEMLVTKKILVTGYGRVAQALADTLKDNKARVYVCARSTEQIRKAECKGFETLTFDRINSYIFHFDYIFNTVPSNIFSSQNILRFTGKYFELASKPYGVNVDYFYKRKNDFIDGSSLPGKYLPLASAEKLAEVIIDYLKNRKGGD